MLVAVINHGKLSWRYALYVLIALDEPLVALDVRQMPLGKMWSVAVLESDLVSAASPLPWVAADEVHLVELYLAAILLARAVTIAHINAATST